MGKKRLFSAVLVCLLLVLMPLFAYAEEDSFVDKVVDAVKSFLKPEVIGNAVFLGSIEVVNAYVSPAKVRPGDTLTVVIGLKDNNGINSVKASIEHENGWDDVNMVLIAGDRYDGTYEVKWKVHDTIVKLYDIKVQIENGIGFKAEHMLEYYDPVAPDPGHSVTQIDWSSAINENVNVGTGILTANGGLTTTGAVTAASLATTGAISAGTTIAATGAVTGGTLTDGTASLTGGALTGVTTIGASGLITATGGLDLGAASIKMQGSYILDDGTPGGLELYGGGNRINLGSGSANGNGPIKVYIGDIAYLEDNNDAWLRINGEFNGVLFTGNVKATGSVTAASFIYSSDLSLKKNIKPISNALERVQQLEGVNFQWKKGDKESIGLIANDVENVFPEIVSTSEDGLKQLEYGNLVAVLIEAVKEQQKEIDSLKEEVDRLK